MANTPEITFVPETEYENSTPVTNFSPLLNNGVVAAGTPSKQPIQSPKSHFCIGSSSHQRNDKGKAPMEPEDVHLDVDTMVNIWLPRATELNRGNMEVVVEDKHVVTMPKRSIVPRWWDADSSDDEGERFPDGKHVITPPPRSQLHARNIPPPVPRRAVSRSPIFRRSLLASPYQLRRPSPGSPRTAGRGSPLSQDRGRLQRRLFHNDSEGSRSPRVVFRSPVSNGSPLRPSRPIRRAQTPGPIIDLTIESPGTDNGSDGTEDDELEEVIDWFYIRHRGIAYPVEHIHDTYILCRLAPL